MLFPLFSLLKRKNNLHLVLYFTWHQARMRAAAAGYRTWMLHCINRIHKLSILYPKSNAIPNAKFHSGWKQPLPCQHKCCSVSRFHFVSTIMKAPNKLETCIRCIALRIDDGDHCVLTSGIKVMIVEASNTHSHTYMTCMYATWWSCSRATREF